MPYKTIQLDTGTANTLKFDSTTLVIDEANNRIGVGTATPSTDFEINSTGANPSILRISGDGNNANNHIWGALEFKNNDSSGGSTGGDVQAKISVETVASYGRGGQIRFWNSSGDDALSEKMTINTDGSVGIGSSEPSKRLHVVDSSNTEIKFESTGGSTRLYLDAKQSGDEGGEIRFTTEGTAKGCIWHHRDGILKFKANGGTGGGQAPDMLIASDGGIVMNNLPTSDPGVAGELWNSFGDVKISAG